MCTLRASQDTYQMWELTGTAQPNDSPLQEEAWDSRSHWQRSHQPARGPQGQEDLCPLEEAGGKPASEVRNHVVRQHFQDHLCPYVSRTRVYLSGWSSAEKCVEIKWETRTGKSARCGVLLGLHLAHKAVCCVVFYITGPTFWGEEKNVYKWIKLLFPLYSKSVDALAYRENVMLHAICNTLNEHISFC